MKILGFLIKKNRHQYLRLLPNTLEVWLKLKGTMRSKE